MREVWTSYKRWMLDDKGYASTTRGTYLGYAHSAHRWLRSNGHTGLPWATDVSIRAYWDTTAPTAESRMHVRAALCAFFACINDLGWRPDNPAASLPKLKRPKRLPRPIMGSDAQKVLDVAQAFDPMVCAIVHLFAYCGIRNAELRAAKWCDLQGNMLRVHGKGDKERVVSVPPIAMAHLARWRTEDPSPDWMFHSDRNWHRPLSKTSLKLLMDEVSDAACVPFTPHILRHTFATELIDVSEGNIAVVQAALGHSSAATTSMYALVKPRNLEREQAKMNYGRMER